MLGLKLPTDPRWVNIAEMHIEDILIDHAYCEQKAASTCISLIIQYPLKKELVDTLTPIVAEEWGHFRMVLRELDKRGYALGKQRKDEYVSALNKLIRSGGKTEDQLLDKLLICGLIEARSCERFRLLSENISDPELKTFYHELMVSEAGHYRTFLDLARLYFPVEDVKARFDFMLSEEVEIMQTIAMSGKSIH